MRSKCPTWIFDTPFSGPSDPGPWRHRAGPPHVVFTHRLRLGLGRAVLGVATAGLVVEPGEGVGHVAAHVESAAAQPQRDVGHGAVAGQLRWSKWI